MGKSLIKLDFAPLKFALLFGQCEINSPRCLRNAEHCIREPCNQVGHQLKHTLHMLTSDGEPEPRAEAPKLNRLLEPEPKLRIATQGSSSGSGSFLFIKDLKKFYSKNHDCCRIFWYNFTILILLG